ncbi:TIGR03943 family putative permease subunit [Niallia sp. 03133]|uniref:TIGR03943 family putative permease subunit n=1 Tax=Niallia sp. 03133 TaxID=3458060 RepID=UPI00404504FF
MKKEWSPDWQLTNELQGIILISFSLLIFKLYVKQTLTLLIAPKMIPFLLVSMAALFFLGFFRLLNSNLKGADCDCDVCDQSTTPIRLLAPYILFFSPLFFFYTIQDFSIHQELLSNNGYASVQKEEKGENTRNVQLKNKIIITDQNFFQVMNHLNTSLDSAAGTEIEINGFVYREKNFSVQEAVIARQVMTHCIADTSIFGYLVKGEVQSLKTGGWYHISGTIEKEEKDGEIMPVLHMKRASAIEEPLNPFLYNF